MIKIGTRTFVPMKVAAAMVGYSVDWVRTCSQRYDFPAKRVYNGRTGFWLHELQRWMKRSVKKTRAA